MQLHIYFNTCTCIIKKSLIHLPDKADFHYFVDMEEIVALREKLLSWYDGNKRDLPWRRLVRY